MIARRGILGALVGLVAAPAIVKVADLMPVKPSLVPGHGLRIGDTLRIRLPNGFAATYHEDTRHYTVDDVRAITAYEPLHVPELSLDEYARRILEPSARVLADQIVETVERNAMLTINEISREAVRLFSEENLFLQGLWDLDPVLDQRVTPVQAAALGAAAVLGRNPVVSRRFFGGVREEGSVASPGSSSSDNPRRITNQETVA